MRHYPDITNMIRSIFRFAQFALLLAAASFAAVVPTLAAERMPGARAQALIKAATEQFHLSYRLRPTEGELRQEQMKAVVAAWWVAPRTRVNDDRLNNWLHEAIRTSMPGSRDPLPPIPNFAGSEPHTPQVPNVTDPPPVTPPEPTPPVTPPEPAPQVAPTVPPAEPAGNADPFRDDPIETLETK